jgi:hypothetical protein
MTLAEFEEFFSATHHGCGPDTEVARIQWRYLDEPGDQAATGLTGLDIAEALGQGRTARVLDSWAASSLGLWSPPPDSLAGGRAR